MRHIFAPDPVTASPLCMGKPSPAAGLVAPARVTPGAPAGTHGAVAGAIDLAAVATTTDQRLSVAFRTHEQPGRRRGTVTGPADIPWTSAHCLTEMLPGAYPLPHLTCSPPVCIGGGGYGADQHVDTRRVGG